jgi:hypothetical protein
MSDLEQQIFKELNLLEEKVLHLNSAAINAERQTDLEVAILNQQLKSLQEKNANASDFVDNAVSLLKGLK